MWRTLNPNELLDRHQHLLNMRDEELDKCTTLRRRLWILDVKLAMEAILKQQQKMIEQNNEEEDKRADEDESTNE